MKTTTKSSLLFTTLLLASSSTGCRVNTGIEDLVREIEVEQTVKISGAWAQSKECAAEEESVATDTSESASSPGHVVFRLPTKHVYRIEARAGAVPQDVSHGLDRLSKGRDGFINTSPDGKWLLVETTRFGCGEDMCLAVVSSSLCRAQVVVSNGFPIIAARTAVLGPNGDSVVYPSNEGNHSLDLLEVHRVGDGWSSPKNLTATSTEKYNVQPAISDDGKHLVFDCGTDPGAGVGTSLCEVNTDGSGFHKAMAPKNGTTKHAALHHADYAPDGHLVFEGTWNEDAEQVWQSPASHPSLVNQERKEEDVHVWRFTDDNSPCVLPDGRIVTLWLGRAESGLKKSSGHELKMMHADGSSYEMLLTNVDVDDIGIGCSK